MIIKCLIMNLLRSLIKFFIYLLLGWIMDFLDLKNFLVIFIVFKCLLILFEVLNILIVVFDLKSFWRKCDELEFLMFVLMIVMLGVDFCFVVKIGCCLVKKRVEIKKMFVFRLKLNVWFIVFFVRVVMIEE